MDSYDRSELTSLETSSSRVGQQAGTSSERNQQNEINYGRREGRIGSLCGENKLHVFVSGKVIVKQLNKLVN